MEESHCRRKNKGGQNHPLLVQNQYQMEGRECPAHIANILAIPRCGGTAQSKIFQEERERESYEVNEATMLHQ